MKFNKVDKATLEKAKEILEKAEDKSQAILEAVELINEAANKDLIERILKESANANAKAQNFNKLGLRQLSDEENKNGCQTSYRWKTNRLDPNNNH